MQMIASHIERPFLVRDFLSEERTLPGLLGSVVARAGFGLILATADRRIVYVNDPAETLMRTSKGALRTQLHQCSRFYVFAKIAIAYHCASQQRDESVQKGSLIIHDEDGAASLVVHVVPLCRRSAKVSPGKEHPVAGLVVVDRQRVLAERIADLSALTPGEARVVAQLISGEGLTKAASRLNIAPSTARSHLILHIFWKRLAHTSRRSLSAFSTKSQSLGVDAAARSTPKLSRLAWLPKITGRV
jgi:hypothetical protein